ncbi:WASH complex subunit strump [Arctopsyche grandis]|uniref:WASH complex subunit strump n=1 Tax=Arctopsyche grandis TaxID=121162 RepID=UPI00406D71CC
MKSSFSAEEVTCIQHVLNSVSHGNAIIAEVLRLKDNIPSVFRLETKEDLSKYGDIIFDFSYFKNTDILEKKISNNATLQELDDEFKENYLSIVTRFYSAFESIFQYITDLNSLLSQLNEGAYIQQSLDTTLQDNDGKQLLCESIYLYGCMLFICEAYIPGHIRERLLVTYHRAAVSHHQTNLDSVCKLLRDTGYRNVASVKRPPNYPEELFKRIPIDDMFIKTVIGRLISEDIYNQLSIYPLPDHRSVALATQAAMLVVCLFFSCNTLTSESIKMREIVDKYFPDNWIVSVYMGITLNLIEVWEPFKAAKLALGNNINSKNIKDISVKHVEQVKKLQQQTNKLLNGNFLKEDKITENINKILCLIRECNVTLRWLMIHTTNTVFYDGSKKCRQVKDQIIADSKFQFMDLFNLLINASLLELSIKDTLRKSLNNKEIKWEEQQKEASQRIIELSEVFSGAKPLPRVAVNESLCNWFKAKSKQIDSLKYDDLTVATKKIIRLIQALEDVQEFHQLDDIMQVKQWLAEARENLKDMVRGGGVTEDSFVALQVCTDLSYGWFAARPFIDLGRAALRQDPAVVSHMRAIFLKLASALEIPLLRINQAESSDLLSVSQYYSNELVNYVKEVLQIIPETVFSLLEKIIEVQTAIIKELPTRLDKDKLKDFAQLDQRMEVAKLTHSVSIFTRGILKMRSTLVGVICIDPKQLLEDGIRSEVSKLVEKRLSNALCNNNSEESLANRLTQLGLYMDGYRRSFEYIQDYINIHGLKIWQEEVSKIINKSKEEECANILRIKSTSVINNVNSRSMFTSLLQDIYALADPKSTVYIEHNNAWYDYKNHQETLRISSFAMIQRSITATGLQAFAHLCGCVVSNNLLHLSKLLHGASSSSQFSLPPLQKTVPNPAKFYSQMSSKVSKNWPQMLERILEIGSVQLLIKHVNYQLNTTCRFDSIHIEASLRAANEAILNDMKKSTMPSRFYLDLLPEINKMMQFAGISDPYNTVYMKTVNNNNIAQMMFLFVIAELPKLEYFQNTGSLMARRSTSHIDGAPFLIGVITLLHQYHEYTLIQFTLLLCQYIMSYIEVGLSSKTAELPVEAQVALKFLENLCRITKIPQTFIETIIPLNILTQQQFMCSKTLM